MVTKHDDASWTNALADLREAPPKQSRSRSLRQSIEDAIDDVISCRQRGYMDSDIIAIFARNGIDMSLHTFRQYVRQALRAKEEQALGGKRKVARATRPQVRDAAGALSDDKPCAPVSINLGKQVETPCGAAAVAERPTPAPQPSNAKAGAISDMASKPARQAGKTAAEVLGHRFSEDV